MTTLPYDSEHPFGLPTDRKFLNEIETRTLSSGATFWNAKPQLQLIAHTAEREETSPWGLLLAVMVNRLSQISPHVVLVKRSGQPGATLSAGTSLNLFGSLVAPTGDGKSVTFKEANELIPPKETPIADGTGQGILKSFAETYRKLTDEDKKPLPEPLIVTRYFSHSVVLNAPEIGTLNAEFIREGSKTDSMLRSLWVGEIVGSTTGDMARKVTLPSNTYRLGGLWGVQPKNAYAILAGAEDGTPQRWVWAPCGENRQNATAAPPRTPPPPGTDFPTPTWGVGGTMYGVGGGEFPPEIDKKTELPSPEWVTWSPQMHIDIKAAQAERKLAKDRDPYAPMTPEQSALTKRVTMESHLTLTKIKLAAALGFLWGHASPDDFDWELAGIMLEVSQRELAGVYAVVQENKVSTSRDRGRDRAVELYAMNEERALLEATDIERHAITLWNKLQKRPLGRSRFSEAWRGDERKLVQIKKVAELLSDGFEFNNHHYIIAQHNDGRYFAAIDGNVIVPDGHKYVPWGQIS